MKLLAEGAIKVNPVALRQRAVLLEFDDTNRELAIEKTRFANSSLAIYKKRSNAGSGSSGNLISCVHSLRTEENKLPAS